MKRNRYLVITALMVCVIAAFGTCFSIFSGTKDNSDLPITPARTSEIILHRTGYTSSYNTETKQPNWVAWHLTKEHVQGKIRRASNAWHEDTDVPKPRVNSYDYKGTGWSRGHMCPAGDNKWNRDAMYETFLYSNVCPQHPRLNSGDWNEIEMACRRWAEKYGDVYIVCGPVFLRQEHEISSVARYSYDKNMRSLVLAKYPYQKHSSRLSCAKTVRLKASALSVEIPMATARKISM